MQKTHFLLFTGVFFAFILMATTQKPTQFINKNNFSFDTSKAIIRGEYLVTVGGCDDCHSPKRMGNRGPEIIPETRFGGYPSDRPIQKISFDALKNGWALMGGDMTSAVGPWGMSFAGNISSDETGIGNWSEEQFITSLRKGKYKGIETSRDLLPPMPWFNYAKMSDYDLKAIFTFLKSSNPVKNVVPMPISPDKLK
jgi:hypothetical protein